MTVKGLLSTRLPEPPELLGRMIAEAPFAVWIVDREGRVVLLNEAMRNLLDIGNPERLLDGYDIFEDPIAKSQGLIPYLKKVPEGQIVRTVVMLDLSREHFGDGKGPKAFYVRALYFPLKNRFGEVEHVAAIIEDITTAHLKELAHSRQEHAAAETSVGDSASEIALCESAIARLEAQLKEVEETIP